MDVSHTFMKILERVWLQQNSLAFTINCNADLTKITFLLITMKIWSLVILFLAGTVSSNATYPVGDIRNCPVSQPTDINAPLLRMEVLPGFGFDNLRNLDMSPIAQRNYSMCKVTNDGRFLIPDNVIVVPLQSSRVETFATFFDHWDNYTSMDSFSINVEASVFSLVSGKFGTQYQQVKEHQYNFDAKTTRTQLRTNLYKIILEPDSQFDTRFRNRLFDIAANIQSNNTFYANYLSDLLVRDYGTHVVKSVDAGAIAARIDSISSSYVNSLNSDKTSITAAASGTFFKGMFSVGVSTAFSHSNSDDTSYLSNLVHSETISIGGPPLHPNMTIEEWSGGLLDNLVAIDRSGIPLHFLLTPDSLPELPSPTLREVTEYVHMAVQRYYGINTHFGCTDPSFPNFDYTANLNDGSCKAPSTNYTFGGVYQTCQVEPGFDYEDLCAKGTAQPNPLTGDFSCPSGYTEIELHSGTVTGVSKKEVCDKICHHCGLFGWSRCCQCMSAWVNVMNAANYQAFWCVAEGQVSANHGYMFGGLYTSRSVNPVTKSMSCPNHFYAVHIGENLEVCVSSEYELGFADSIPFGGFQSCQAGNPLAASTKLSNSPNVTFNAANSPKRCPKTYTKVLATVDEHCEISYCVKLKNQGSAAHPTLPPYRTKAILKKNLTQSLVIQGAYGEIWVKNEQGNWVEDQSQMLSGNQLLQKFFTTGEGTASVIPPSQIDDHNSNGKSAAVSAGISVGATLFACTLIAVAILGAYSVWKRKKQRKRLRGNSNYLRIAEDVPAGNSSPTSRNIVTSYMGVNDGDQEDGLKDEV